MANVYAEYAFDQRASDLSNLLRFFASEYFSDNENYVFEGVTYQDLYEVVWYDGAYFSTIFAGSSFSNSDDSVTGTVTAVLESVYSGGEWVILYGITGISVSSAALLSAAQTDSTTDDYVIINGALSGSDNFYLSDASDYADGRGGNDKMYGYDGSDTLYGGNNNDKLYGGTGNDTLRGDSGNDSLQGDAGKDSLTGGSGTDSFIFRSVSESATGATTADVITDFVSGTDKINLSAIDASTILGGNNAFSFNGTTKFGTSTQGEIYYKKFSDHTMVYIDNDNDSTIEMAIRLTGLHNLTASDFVL